MVQTYPVERFMDEVDGKPGHVALQSGHTNAHGCVPTDLLSLPQIPQQILITPRKTTGEQHHENVSGK
jgi:hypothetical protein